MKLEVLVNNNKYPIYIEKGLLDNVENYIRFSSKNLLLTDTNIPDDLINKIKVKCDNLVVCKVAPGEVSKSFDTFIKVQEVLLENGFTRSDLIISLGGGVIGDLGGFLASTYKRGCRFINIPTTTLSMVDSSIGGKNGINFCGVKNVIGSFYQPEVVLVDVNSLKSLPNRHYYNGLVEALKSGYIRNEALYNLFKLDINEHLEEIIIESLKVKKEVVEIDPYEKGLRKILNFGHTFGHAIESFYNLEEVYHGEAVAIGMMKVINDEFKDELKGILSKMNISVDKVIDKEHLIKYLTQDKKVKDGMISIIKVNKIGIADIVDITLDEACELFLK